MYKTTIYNSDGTLAEWYSHREPSEATARIIGELVEKNKAWKHYEVLGSNHLGEYAYFNYPTLAGAIIGIGEFLLNYPFELHSGCPAELSFEMRQTNDIGVPVWFCSYPQKKCGWI